MAAQTLSQAHQPNRFLDLYRHLVDLAIASVEMALATGAPCRLTALPQLWLGSKPPSLFDISGVISVVSTPVRSTKDLIDREKVQMLINREEQRLNANTEVSAQYYERAKKHMVGGVPSSYQARDPWPIYLSNGKGSKVWDVDGNEIVDFHNGFGSMVQGHAHPAIVKAVQDGSRSGTHFAAPIEGRHRRQRGAGQPLRPAAWRYRQLRLRGDDGRHPHRPRLHRPRHDHEDLRLVPWPPRLRDGLDRRALRQDRRPRRTTRRCHTAPASRRRSST